MLESDISVLVVVGIMMMMMVVVAGMVAVVSVDYSASAFEVAVFYSK